MLKKNRQYSPIVTAKSAAEIKNFLKSSIKGIDMNLVKIELLPTNFDSRFKEVKIMYRDQEIQRICFDLEAESIGFSDIFFGPNAIITYLEGNYADDCYNGDIYEALTNQENLLNYIGENISKNIERTFTRLVYCD